MDCSASGGSSGSKGLTAMSSSFGKRKPEAPTPEPPPQLQACIGSPYVALRLLESADPEPASGAAGWAASLPLFEQQWLEERQQQQQAPDEARDTFRRSKRRPVACDPSPAVPSARPASTALQPSSQRQPKEEWAPLARAPVHPHPPGPLLLALPSGGQLGSRQEPKEEEEAEREAHSAALLHNMVVMQAGASPALLLPGAPWQPPPSLPPLGLGPPPASLHVALPLPPLLVVPPQPQPAVGALFPLELMLKGILEQQQAATASPPVDPPLASQQPPGSSPVLPASQAPTPPPLQQQKRGSASTLLQPAQTGPAPAAGPPLLAAGLVGPEKISSAVAVTGQEPQPQHAQELTGAAMPAALPPGPLQHTVKSDPVQQGAVPMEEGAVAPSQPSTAATAASAGLCQREGNLEHSGLGGTELASPPAPAGTTSPMTPSYAFVVRSGADVMAAAGEGHAELAGVREALEVQDGLSAAILEGVLGLAEGKVAAGDRDVSALLRKLGLGGEKAPQPPHDGLLPGPGGPCSLILRSMLGLAATALEGGLLLPERRRTALDQLQTGLREQLAGGSSKQQRGVRARLAEAEAAAQRLPAAGGGASSQPPLSQRVLANFLALRERMAATPHAELCTGASSQAEVAEQLVAAGALEGRDWVQVTPAPWPGCAAGPAATLLAGGAGARGLPLRDGRCIVSANDGQQVLEAQPTDCRRVVAAGRAHLLLLRRVMDEHAQLLQGCGDNGNGRGGSEAIQGRAGQESPWSPANPAHQALYWLALGMATPRAQAVSERVGYYHSEIQLHSTEVARHLGAGAGPAHPSLAPPPPAAAAACAVQRLGFDQALLVGAEAAAGFDPGAWPWQNCTAWGLTDRLSGQVLRAQAEGGGDLRLPLLPGINCSFGIVTAAASLAVHLEDFCGGSTNQCWGGFKLWVYVSPAALEGRRSLAAKLMGKQLPPEWLLSDRDILPHCQLALQLPGQLMIIKPGRAYHGVAVPGFCLAEAGNHWQLLERRRGGNDGSSNGSASAVGTAAAPAAAASVAGREGGEGEVGVEAWLAQWAALRLRCARAWQARMRPLWCFFLHLRAILAGCAGQLAGPLGGGEGGALVRAVESLLQLGEGLPV